MFPVMLRVEGRRCLVVGGGGVALRKVQSLVAEGARVTVVTPEAVEALEEMAARGQLTLERRPYRAGEAADYALVFAATDCRDVNRQVYEDADGAGVWANAADDPELCSFHLPARVQRGSLQIAVASGGDAPFAVRRVRQLLERRFGHEWDEWLASAARFRSHVRDLGLELAEQEVHADLSGAHDDFLVVGTEVLHRCAVSTLDEIALPLVPEDNLLGFLDFFLVVGIPDDTYVLDELFSHGRHAASYVYVDVYVSV